MDDDQLFEVMNKMYNDVQENIKKAKNEFKDENEKLDKIRNKTSEYKKIIPKK